MLQVGASTATSPPYYDDFGNLLKFGQLVPETRTCSIEYSMGGNGASSSSGPWTISQGGYTWNSYQKFSSLQTTRIAAKIVFVDEASGSVDDGVFAMYPVNTFPAPGEWWNMPGSRHLNGCVFSFADGHVEYWKWHGTVVPSSYWQTMGSGKGGNGIAYETAADISDDLARVQAGGPQYP